jgi:hypothetical protein
VNRFEACDARDLQFPFFQNNWFTTVEHPNLMQKEQPQQKRVRKFVGKKNVVTQKTTNGMNF